MITACKETIQGIFKKVTDTKCMSSNEFFAYSLLFVYGLLIIGTVLTNLLPIFVEWVLLNIR